MDIQERYHAALLAADATYTASQGVATGTGGFLATTAGTITITKQSGQIAVDDFPVTAGTYHPLPFFLGYEFTVTLAGGASGTLAIF